MAFSVNTPIGNGSTKQFAVNFTNGIFARENVSVFIEGEVDSLGQLIPRPFTWINDGLIEVEGEAPASGARISIRRIMNKSEPAVDFADGEILTEETADKGLDHLLNSIHELLDGYGLSSVQTEINMNGNKITNLGIPKNPTDAARLSDVGPDSAATLRTELASQDAGKGAALVKTQANRTVEQELQIQSDRISDNTDTLDDRVITVATAQELQDYPAPKDNQQFSVIDVGLFYYSAVDDTFYPQSIVVTRGDTFPTSPYDNQFFILEPSSLYYYNESTAGWVLVVDPSVLQSYVDQAEAAATSAESARDAAIASSSGIYADTATGLAATVEGDYFSTISSDNSTFLVLYLHDTGSVATEIVKYPSAAALDFKSEQDLASAHFAVVDEGGKTPFYIKPDGTTVLYSILLDDSDIGPGESALYGYAFTDGSGNIALGIRDTGQVVMKSAKVSDLSQVETINGKPVEDFGSDVVATKDKPSGFTSEINGIASYGQSLSIGSTSLPVVSTSQKYDNLMFNSGVRTQDGGTDPGVIYQSLVPLVESSNGAGLGETPVSGAADHIKELIAEENGLTFDSMSYQMLGTAPGSGGTNIAGLEKDTTQYLKLISDIKYSFLTANTQNKSYAYQATTWMQGEADYSGETPKELYKLKLNKLVADIVKDSRSETKQTFNPEFISYQVGSHLRYAQSVGIDSAFEAQIAQAQLETSIENPAISLACPMYAFDYSGTVNQVHLTATDEKVVGAYFGLVYKRVVIDGEKWEPLRPESITRSGKSVYIKMKVPKPPLVLDTGFVAQNRNYGFRVFDDSGTEVLISAVSIVNQESIKLELTNTVTGPIEVDYALFSDHPTGETGRLVGARGNIRDSQGNDIVFDPAGINRPMHNWLVMFKYKEGESTWL